jgi:serine protease Do
MLYQLRLLPLLVFALAVSSPAMGQQPNLREEKLKKDRQRVEALGVWIYNDLPTAFALARQSGKPLLVVLRCVPCEECVKLDDELVDQDPVVRPLLDQFVCARQVSTNGIDLEVFQFDTDQSWAVFLLNADGTVYGRYGTRSHRTEWVGDVSIDGLAEAMRGALELHANYPNNRTQLAGKQGKPLEVESPEEFPSLEGRYTDQIATTNVVPSCIHCHQIGEARLSYYRDLGQPIPEELLYPFPHPNSIGLTLKPDERATVIEVADDSPAQAAGLQPGDRILSLAEQPLLSIADVQWVLNGIDARGSSVTAEIDRAGEKLSLVLRLDSGWRRKDDASWRASTWAKRRMATGGMVLEQVAAEERERLGIPADKTALRVKHVGQYGPHAVAKQAGVRVGDVVIAFAGRGDLAGETALIHYALTELPPREQVPVEVIRDGKRISLNLVMQN